MGCTTDNLTIFPVAQVAIDCGPFGGDCDNGRGLQHGGNASYGWPPTMARARANGLIATAEAWPRRGAEPAIKRPSPLSVLTNAHEHSMHTSIACTRA